MVEQSILDAGSCCNVSGLDNFITNSSTWDNTDLRVDSGYCLDTSAAVTLWTYGYLMHTPGMMDDAGDGTSRYQTESGSAQHQLIINSVAAVRTRLKNM